MTEGRMTKAQPNGRRNRRVEVLSAIYQQSRNEGLQIVHSMFRDFGVILLVVVTIMGGQIVTNKPELLIIIPIFLGVYGAIVVGKLRVNNLVTSYMIYLERLLNKELASPLVIWNSVIISKKVSVGRQSKWGYLALGIGFLFGTTLYIGFIIWIYTLNGELFNHNALLRLMYFTINGIIYLFIIYQVLSVLTITRKYTPEHLERMAQQYFADQFGHNDSKT